MENNDTNRIMIVGNVPPANNNKWHQRNDVFDEEGICCTLTATMYKDAPRILIRREKKDV